MVIKTLMDHICKLYERPGLFEPGYLVKTGRGCDSSGQSGLETPKFWDDPHISKGMLEAHLDPENDAASRRPETIDEIVGHWLGTGLLRPGMRVLDLGCGPGLYAERLCRAGIHVVGLDLSERSLQYAVRHAKEEGLDLEYRCMDFFSMDYENAFDAAIQVYGELCTFSDEARDRLLMLVRRALKKEGLFVFDVTTRALRAEFGLKNGWRAGGEDFWHPGRHLLLEQGFDYPEQSVWLDQYAVLDEQELRVYRNWFHDYTLEAAESFLGNAGFKLLNAWDDLAGSRYTKEGKWIGIAAVKVI